MLKILYENSDDNTNKTDENKNKDIKTCADLLEKPPNEKQKSNFVGLQNQGATC